MALIDELHERRKILSDSRDEMRASLRQTEAEIDDLTVAIWALEGTTEEEGRALQTEATAIAALTPAPDFTAEQETAREQLEREPEEEDAGEYQDGYHPGALKDGEVAFGIGSYNETQPVADEQGDASEFAQPMPDPEFVVLDVQNDYDSTGVLTADDLHAVAMPNYAAFPAEVTGQPQPQPEWNEPQPTEGYAPVTNPEADTIARAYEYYSPEKMGDRNRSVFDIFRHKREDA